jgi:DNA-binding NtrC family response regulator
VLGTIPAALDVMNATHPKEHGSCTPHPKGSTAGEESCMARLLVVDDDEAIVFALSEFLATRGHVVDQATDLRGAEASLAAHTYDLLITDLCLTGRGSHEGFQLLRQVRRSSPQTACVLITAQESAEVQHEALRLGAVAVLVKPLPLNSLAETLSRVIALP